MNAQERILTTLRQQLRQARRVGDLVGAMLLEQRIAKLVR